MYLGKEQLFKQIQEQVNKTWLYGFQLYILLGPRGEKKARGYTGKLTATSFNQSPNYKVANREDYKISVCLWVPEVISERYQVIHTLKRP